VEKQELLNILTACI